MRIEVHPDGDAVSVRMRHGGGVHRMRYRSPGTPLTPGSDTALAGALLAAMLIRSPLEIDAPVSSRLLGAIPRIQEIVHLWDRDSDAPAVLGPVPVVAPARPGGPSADGWCVASFLTAGFDSYFTALKHRHKIDTLIFVHGFDVPLDDTELRLRVISAVRRAADALGKRLVEVETDLREFSDRHCRWDLYHGAALASVAMLLSPVVQRVYVPTGATWSTLVPWNSHPLLNPLWTTDEGQVVHDGCEATRLEKVRAIAGDDAAGGLLRVCWENRSGAYNCGSCEKCIRTMACLRGVGAQEAFPSFPCLDLAAVARMRPRRARPSWTQTLRGVERWGGDPDLADAIRTALRPPARTGS